MSYQDRYLVVEYQPKDFMDDITLNLFVGVLADFAFLDEAREYIDSHKNSHPNVVIYHSKPGIV